MLTLDTFKKMISAAGEEIRSEEKYFSRLDAEAGGDGDHGTAMVTAFNAMAKAEGNDFKSYLKALSDHLQSAACGSASTLYGTWLEGMSDAARQESDALDAAAVAAVFKGGLEELSFITRARIGHKTMMDALIPATEAMEAARGDGVKAMFVKAAEAAETGAEATCQMRAKFGRARNLGERSIGARDAGASSVASIFATFAASL